MNAPLQVTPPSKAKSAKERQRAFRERRAAEGLVTCSILVPAHLVGQLHTLAAKLMEDRTLEIGTLRSCKTGKMVALER